MVRNYRARRGLKGSATEDWIVRALAMQDQPHDYEQGRADGCRHCGLPATAEVHTEDRAR